MKRKTLFLFVNIAAVVLICFKDVFLGCFYAMGVLVEYSNKAE